MRDEINRGQPCAVGLQQKSKSSAARAVHPPFRGRLRDPYSLKFLTSTQAAKPKCSIIRASRLRECGDHIVRRQRPPDSLQLEFSDRLDFDLIFNGHQHSEASKDLSWLGFIANFYVPASQTNDRAMPSSFGKEPPTLSVCRVLTTMARSTASEAHPYFRSPLHGKASCIALR
jgi:hypothetical protein